MKEIKINHLEYPKILKETNNPPEKLYCLGKMPKNEDMTVSIVGTRKATIEGLKTAKEIAKGLAEKGIVIVSGLALGIDSAAHEGALEANGKTLAVLGSGLNFIYPKQNKGLAKKIIDSGGGLLSEYKPDSPPEPQQFLERNRIIAGISIATVVVEAPIRSGALVTAKFATYAGREVFVIPGPIQNQNYQGSHMFIREGARLVTSAKEILEDLKNAI